MDGVKRINLFVPIESHKELRLWAVERGWSLQELMSRIVASALKGRPMARRPVYDPAADAMKPAPSPPQPAAPPPVPRAIERICAECSHEMPLTLMECANCGASLEGCDLKLDNGYQVSRGDVDENLRLR